MAEAARTITDPADNQPTSRRSGMTGRDRENRSSLIPPLRETGKKQQKNTSELAALRERARLAEKLLSAEAEIRACKSVEELRYFAANEFHSLTGATQVLIHRSSNGLPTGTVSAVKGIAIPDPNAPLLRWLESEITTALKTAAMAGADVEPDGTADFRTVQTRLNLSSVPSTGFSTPCLLTVPLYSPTKAKPLGAVSFLSKRPLEPRQVSMATRLCMTFAHAQSRFASGYDDWFRAGVKPASLALLLVFSILMFLPVTMTVLAPATTEPINPEVVAAPVSGVIETVHVRPNQSVRKGDLLFSFNATEWQNDHDLAIEKAAIARARFKRANQDAFSAGDGRRELAIARAELALAEAEKQAARRLLDMTNVYALSSGIVLFSGREKWKGRPVSTGERVMRISDASRLQFAIELAVEDNIDLPEAAEARIFLDAAPLSPISARISNATHEAELSRDNRLIFPLRAAPDNDAGSHLRLGQRGTAQLYGRTVPLWFYLFRKPISYIRQTFGI